MGRACDAHGEKRNTYRVSVGNPEGMRLFVRTGHR
jgi:hypothetical protein